MYSDEILDEIETRMIEGENLVEICSHAHMPDRKTVYRWMDQMPDFATRCARAREGFADFQNHRILKEIEGVTAENANAARVKISGMQWIASKAYPKRYGDHKEVNVQAHVGIHHTRKLDVSGVPTEQLEVLEQALRATVLNLEANKDTPDDDSEGS